MPKNAEPHAIVRHTAKVLLLDSRDRLSLFLNVVEDQEEPVLWRLQAFLQPTL